MSHIRAWWSSPEGERGGEGEGERGRERGGERVEVLPAVQMWQEE